MRFEILNSNSTSQPYYWRIVSSNNQVLATSETYVNKQGCLNAISVVQRGAASAPVHDLTRTATRAY